MDTRMVFIVVIFLALQVLASIDAKGRPKRNPYWQPGFPQTQTHFGQLGDGFVPSYDEYPDWTSSSSSSDESGPPHHYHWGGHSWNKHGSNCNSHFHRPPYVRPVLSPIALHTTTVAPLKPSIVDLVNHVISTAPKETPEKPLEHNHHEKKPEHEHVHEKPAHEKPVHEKPVHEKPSHEKPSHEKPAHEKPVHEKPSHEKPAHEKPVHQKPTKDEFVEVGFRGKSSIPVPPPPTQTGYYDPHKPSQFPGPVLNDSLLFDSQTPLYRRNLQKKENPTVPSGKPIDFFRQELERKRLLAPVPKIFEEKVVKIQNLDPAHEDQGRSLGKPTLIEVVKKLPEEPELYEAEGRSILPTPSLVDAVNNLPIPKKTSIAIGKEPGQQDVSIYARESGSQVIEEQKRQEQENNQIQILETEIADKIERIVEESIRAEDNTEEQTPTEPPTTQEQPSSSPAEESSAVVVVENVNFIRENGATPEVPMNENTRWQDILNINPR